ncbi:MAG: glycosyl hydrolase-related protein [Treponema sp.]|jgi:alpha-mannosidase|nr:glycosyl hydrolase-related protein [Treponema sp.]
MIRMNESHAQLEVLEDYVQGEHSGSLFNRVYAELRFLASLSDSRGGAYDDLVKNAAVLLAGDIAKTGGVSAEAAARTEASLTSLADEAKSFEFLCAAHAHIDMNWMWGYHETVSVTLATMRTMLDMMEEFGGFTFSQSQASVYRIVEQFAPEMFAEIQRRVREKRWEITASTWTECDKNMSSGESLTRHILYTKEYMKEKFGIAPDDLAIDFEPDTFGHSRNIPEILDSGGVRYYYHCRGQVGEKVLYRWKAPSGKTVIVYTEPFWYNADIDSFTADYAPELARLTGSKKLLKVYGVGNHGGGPTRRDINRLIEMNSWPLYPKFTFGHLRSYFDSIACLEGTLPLLDDEINFICDGCYTTQTRIKAGNRKAERLMKEAEFYASASMITLGKEYPASLLKGAWRNILFNQFHDIIPGSGVAETREYASGLYQEVFAAAESVRTLALEETASSIDTEALAGGGAAAESWESAKANSRGEGAGTGYGQTGRGAGKKRAYHIFNPLPFKRREIVPITVWDYEGNIREIALRNQEGKTIDIQNGESGNYWGHHFDTVFADVQAPASGYTTVIIEEKKNYEPHFIFINDMRVQKPDQFILENEHIKAALNPRNGGIASFIDKASGADLAAGEHFGIFRLAHESVYKGITNWHPGMSAWFAGRFKEIAEITDNIEIIPVIYGSRHKDDLYGHTDAAAFERKKLRSAFILRAHFGSASSFEAVVSLDAGSKRLRYDLECDWREFGSDEKGGAPNLHFYLPLNYTPRFRFDIPFGVTERKSVDMDLPGESFVLAENSAGPVSLALLSMDTYGFRCLDNSISLTLIRGSYDPDPAPEAGRHRISFALVPSVYGGEEIVRESLSYRHPFTVISGRIHAGSLPAEGSLFSLEEGSAVVSAIKRPEAGGKRLLLRVYETAGKNSKAVFKLGFKATSAYLTDATETKCTGEALLEGGKLSFDVPPFSVRAVILELE